jgi:hypothetical protein
MRGSADLNSRALKKGVGEMKIFQWDKISEKMSRAITAYGFQAGLHPACRFRLDPRGAYQT